MSQHLVQAEHYGVLELKPLTATCETVPHLWHLCMAPEATGKMESELSGTAH